MLDHQPRARAELRKYTPRLCTKEAGSYTYVRAREVPALTHVRPPAWSVYRALEIYSEALSTKEAGSPTYVRAWEVPKSEVGIGLNPDVMMAFLLLKYQIWGQLGPCNSIRVQPYAFETAYQCLKHIIYV